MDDINRTSIKIPPLSAMHCLNANSAL